MLYQRTLKRTVLGSGIGLHSGRLVQFKLHPSGPNTGITFIRTDLSPMVEIPARADRVLETRLATTLGEAGASVGTVEHLMAALAGLGIDNARIEIDGPEVPIFDGSSQIFVELIRRAGGTMAQRRPKRFIVIRKPVVAEDGDRSARLEPARTFSLAATIDFKHPLITDQHFEFRFSDRAFLSEICAARTFGFARDVEAMRAKGLALGGSLENAIVLDAFSIQNPEGLRFADEFVRHKILDAIGDLALLGAPIIGRYVGHKAGHCLNAELTRRLLAQPRSFEVIEFQKRRDAEVQSVELPTIGLGRLAPI